MKRFMFLFAAACLLVLGSSLVYAQDAPTADFTFLVTIGSVPLSIDGVVDLELDDAAGGLGLVPGVSVAAVPDGQDAWLQAGINGSGTTPYMESLEGVPAAFDIYGAPGANVVISFALPYILYPQNASSGVIHVDYNGTSACWFEAGNGVAYYFNPKLAETAPLPTTGDPLHVNLGGIFTVDKNAPADTYQGVGIVTVAYAAN